MKICKYRNCGCPIPKETRSDANYCNIKCRQNEMTYQKREKRRIRKEKNTINSILIEAENQLDKNIIELYKEIYKK